MSEHGILDLSDAQYRAADGISQSELKYLLPPKTPAHYRAYKEMPPKPPTPAQRIGTLVHSSLLIPDAWEGKVVVKPEDMSFATKDGKKWREDNKGTEIISTEDKYNINGMVKSLWAHPIAKKLLDGARKEASVFAKDDNGLLRKARIDAIPAGGNTLIDIKTTSDASLDAFNRSILNYSYYAQSAYYLDIMKLIGQERDVFIFICVESEFPWLVACYPIDVLSIEIGQKIYRGALTTLKACLETGVYPGYPENLDTFCGIPMHSYLMKEMA